MHWSSTMLLIGLSWVAVTSPARGQDAASPNVVLILTDDMGWGDLSSYGAADVRTPSIDSLAREGVRLTDFYANGPVCTPTRAALISGRYQQRYGLQAPLGSEGTPTGVASLPATGRSLPHLLAQRGYATALMGKWHLGYRPESSPAAHGFSDFFGMKSGYHDYYAHTGGDGKPDLWENDRQVTAEGYTTDLITARSIRFLEQQEGRPFFLEIAYNAPHWPYQVPDRASVAAGNARHVRPWDETTGTRAEYVAMVERVDRGVGEVLRTIERLGLARRTIVIFTNDNGGEWLSDNGPHFNRKASVWEGGIRVPAIVRWPGRIPAGRVSGQVGITMDLTASILAASGATVAADVRLDGIDLFPVLEGRMPEVPRTLFWRTGNPAKQQWAVRSGDWKLVLDAGSPFVFDVRRDPGERNNLTRMRQDVARRLKPLLDAWEQDVDGEWKASGVNPPLAPSPR